MQTAFPVSGWIWQSLSKDLCVATNVKRTHRLAVVFIIVVHVNVAAARSDEGEIIEMFD